jgi:hypothetical protein
MNLFNLAEAELKRGGKISFEELKELRYSKVINKQKARYLYNTKVYKKSEIIKKAVKIRRWFDIHKGVGNRILAGEMFLQYDNRFIFK